MLRVPAIAKMTESVLMFYFSSDFLRHGDFQSAGVVNKRPSFDAMSNNPGHIWLVPMGGHLWRRIDCPAQKSPVSRNFLPTSFRYERYHEGIWRSRENRNENRHLAGFPARVRLVIGCADLRHADPCAEWLGRRQNPQQFPDQFGCVCGLREAGTSKQQRQ